MVLSVNGRRLKPVASCLLNKHKRQVANDFGRKEVPVVAKRFKTVADLIVAPSVTSI